MIRREIRCASCAPPPDRGPGSKPARPPADQGTTGDKCSRCTRVRRSLQRGKEVRGAGLRNASNVRRRLGLRRNGEHDASGKARVCIDGGLPRNQREASAFSCTVASVWRAEPAQWPAYHHTNGRGGLPRNEREAKRERERVHCRRPSLPLVGLPGCWTQSLGLAIMHWTQSKKAQNGTRRVADKVMNTMRWAGTAEALVRKSLVKRSGEQAAQSIGLFSRSGRVSGIRASSSAASPYLRSPE